MCVVGKPSNVVKERVTCGTGWNVLYAKGIVQQGDSGAPERSASMPLFRRICNATIVV